MSEGTKQEPKNTTGIMVLMVVVAVDSLLLLWGWHWYQNRGTSASPLAAVGGTGDGGPAAVPGSSENLLPTAPIPADLADDPPPAHASGAAAPTRPPAMNQIPVGPGIRLAGQAGPPASKKAPPQLAEAVAAYQALKPKYRGTKFYRSWTNRFLSYPDLNAANRRYFADHDAMAFINATVRSPNFGRMIKEFAQRPELAGFSKDLMAKQSVMASARAVFDDPKLMAAVKDLAIPGLPTMGTLMGWGEKRQMKRQVDTGEMMKKVIEANPDMQKQLDGRRQ